MDLKKLKHARDLSRFYRVKGPSQAFINVFNRRTMGRRVMQIQKRVEKVE